MRSLPVIVLDPGHGNSADQDSFRRGPSGEREEWINLRVCLLLKEILQKKYEVYLTRSEDKNISLADRVKLAVDKKASLFLSVHHASCDPVFPHVNFPFCFVHGSLLNSQNQHLIESFQAELSKANHGPALTYSDLFVFDKGLYILRELHAHSIASVITEYSFFSHPDEEQLLKSQEYCQKEAAILAKAVEVFFQKTSFESFEKSDVYRFPLSYKHQLQKQKELLLSECDSPEQLWSHLWQQGKDDFILEKYESAFLNFEKVLAINIYFPLVCELLAQMIVCCQKLGDSKKEKIILQVSEFVSAL